MSTDLLMAAGVAIILAAICAGYGLCVIFERRKRRRQQLERSQIRSSLRRLAGGRR